jgi:F420-0:gamma-glutamyl ligase
VVLAIFFCLHSVAAFFTDSRTQPWRHCTTKVALLVSAV